MARLGMDDVAVETVGKQLQDLAQQIDTLTGQINTKVHSLPGIWDGPDAHTFVDQWWPGHQKTLKAAAEAVRGLGQSALNNVKEQRDASGR